MTSPVETPLAPRLFACALLCIGAILQLAGTDLVLPAIPDLPDQLGGDEVRAQFVLASYTVGVALGLIAFGAAGARFGRRRLLIVSAFAFAIVSFIAGQAQSMDQLIALRVLQGFVSAAPTVFGAGLIRAMFTEAGATKAIGALGSLESLAPAIAPIIGVWLLTLGDWSLSFDVLAVAAFISGLLLLAFRGVFEPSVQGAPKTDGSYLKLARSPTYLRYALSQATVLGGLLTFVLSAPVIIVDSMGGGLTDFVIMQVTGISCFILASNTSGFLVTRFGPERLIWIGTSMAFVTMVGMAIYAGFGGNNTLVMTAFFVPLNAGLGLRGPPGFLRAIIAGDGDDDRAASLMILSILSCVAVGTAAMAPFLSGGLFALSLGVVAFELAAVLLLALLPPLQQTNQ
ncbi:MAG: MFS transporter [Pseudomonadota bacterium]